MRIYVTAQRRQGITEPAKEVSLPVGRYLTANFVVPGKPARDNRPGTKDIVVAVAVPADNKRMTKNLTLLSQPSVSPELENSNLLMTGLAEIVQDYLLTLENSDLEPQAQTYVRTVTENFTWGPGGMSGTADLVLFPSTMDVVSKKVIARRSQLMSDATLLRTQRDENGTPRITANGNKLRQVGPCYKSLIAAGMLAGRCRVWATKITQEMFDELTDEDLVVGVEGELVKKGWKTSEGDERSNLEVQASVLFPVGLKPELAYETPEEQAQKAAKDADTTSAEVIAMNNDDDDDNEVIDDY